MTNKSRRYRVTINMQQQLTVCQTSQRRGWQKETKNINLQNVQ